MTREEAIKKVRQMSLPEETMEILEALATELRESEDERIRKKLIEIIGYFRSRGIDQQLCEEFLAYLEKQKEQKHPNGCFTCDEYKKGYETGRLNGFTAGYNKAMKEVDQQEQKPEERFEEAREKYQVEWSKEEAAEDIYKIPFGTRAEDFIAGAEWQASQMPMPEDTVLFNKGVAEGRRLEREDSVECEVTDVGFNYLDLALFDAESLELKSGDKVKVIVLKDNEDESK